MSDAINPVDDEFRALKAHFLTRFTQGDLEGKPVYQTSMDRSWHSRGMLSLWYEKLRAFGRSSAEVYTHTRCDKCSRFFTRFADLATVADNGDLVSVFWNFPDEVKYVYPKLLPFIELMKYQVERATIRREVLLCYGTQDYLGDSSLHNGYTHLRCHGVRLLHGWEDTTKERWPLADQLLRCAEKYNPNWILPALEFIWTDFVPPANYAAPSTRKAYAAMLKRFHAFAVSLIGRTYPQKVHLAYRAAATHGYYFRHIRGVLRTFVGAVKAEVPAEEINQRFARRAAQSFAKR